MSYRNIEVDGNTYRYVVGRQYVKIQKNDRAFALIKLEEFGVRIAESNRFVATPHVMKVRIRELEKTGKLQGPIEFTCKRHGVKTNEFAVDPFEVEIYDRKELMLNCPHCIEERADDI